MSKTHLLHKGLNLNQNAFISTFKKEIVTENESDIQTPIPNSKPKVKKKQRKNVSPRDQDRQSTIESLLNETKNIFLNKKSPKRKKSQKVDQSFTPKASPIIKQEPVDEESELEDEIQNDSASHVLNNEHQSISTQIRNEDDEEALSQTDHSRFRDETPEDNRMMNTIENKIHVLQNVQISPSKAITPMERLNELYPNLKLVSLSAKLKLKDSDDVYLFRIPKTVDPQNLLNTDINLEDKCKVKLKGEKYLIRPTSKIPDPTLVLSKKTDVIHFKKNIVMEKYVKVIKDPHIPLVEKSNVPLPNNLKKRHPIFGSNFKEKIHLNEAVEKKLDDAIKNLLKQSKKKKQNKKVKQENLLANSTLLPDISTVIGFSPNVSNISPQKKLKERKHHTTVKSEPSSDDIFGTKNDVKNKKHKVKKDHSFMNDIFNNGTEVTKAKKCKIKEEPEEISPFKRKNKKLKLDLE